MNPRTIRRAIERKAQKQANKEATKSMAAATSSHSFAGEDCIEEELPAAGRTISERQLLANHRNATRSTGPTSPEGKSRSAKNALKTGLTGRTILLANEEATLYENHLKDFFTELNPEGDRETELVQSIADSKWRLARIPSLEFGIYALGRIEFAEEFQNLPKAEAAALIEAKTFLAYQRQISNLSIQECRLRRQCEKDSAELTRLQQLRIAESRKRKVPGNLAQPNLHSNENGFEFETATLASLEIEFQLEDSPRARPQAA